MNNMFSEKKNLQNKIKILADLLKERKNKIGDYYEMLYQKTDKVLNNYELEKIVHEIIASSGKIEDLATFNYKEKRTLEEIFLLSQEILDRNI